MATHQKVAIVTGAGTGIGKAVALALLESGYRVAFAGRRREPLDEAIAQSGARRAAALAVPTDVADPGVGAGAVRDSEGGVRPSRRAVQQRRCRRAGRQPRRPDVRAMEERRRHQPHRRLPVHAGGDPDHEGRRRRAAAASSTTDRSPRMRRAPIRRPTRRPSTRSPASPSRRRSTAASTTSRAARSTSATRTTEMAARMAKGVPQANGQIARRAADGRRARRERRRLHGEPAARRQRPVHDHHGDEDAVRRSRLG